MTGAVLRASSWPFRISADRSAGRNRGGWGGRQPPPAPVGLWEPACSPREPPPRCERPSQTGLVMLGGGGSQRPFQLPQPVPQALLSLWNLVLFLPGIFLPLNPLFPCTRLKMYPSGTLREQQARWLLLWVSPPGQRLRPLFQRPLAPPPGCGSPGTVHTANRGPRVQGGDLQEVPLDLLFPEPALCSPESGAPSAVSPAHHAHTRGQAAAARQQGSSSCRLDGGYGSGLLNLQEPLPSQ